jgi:membrane-bound lytic murein transglycosylase D
VSQSDIARRAVEVFGDSGTSAPAPVDSGPSWDIDVHSYESTARVEHYVRLFSGSAKDYIETRLERGTRFEPMIRAKMREGGLPEDMYYLALVESGFDPNAYSRAAAVGMWQFMTSTGRDMGLRVDWWVDERRDPVKSTAAAVRFIKGLKEQFGSLYLAAAAYNGGPGRVARGLTRYADDLEGTSGDDLFFALAAKDYLRNETREYVPQLIAAALIAKEPERYGMSITPRSPFAYDSVRVGPGMPMAAVAHAAGTQLTTLMDLNPQVLRGMTPPKDSSFIRIPVGAADSFDIALARLPKSERVGTRTMSSKKGESFSSIARREGIGARQLSLYNPKLKLLKSGNLAPGQTVLVPTAAVASAALSVPDPSLERYSSSRSSTMHVVKGGETLGGIAKKYHTTTALLMKRNGLRRAIIFPGQSLVVVGSASPKPAAKKAKPKGALASKR